MREREINPMIFFCLIPCFVMMKENSHTHYSTLDLDLDLDSGLSRNNFEKIIDADQYKKQNKIKQNLLETLANYFSVAKNQIMSL